MKAIDRLNFERPTPIQKESIPIGIRGDDIIAVAQTGSGKTLAFGIPMLQRLSKSKRGTGLVVVPTRELALQVEESIHAVSGSVNIRSAVLIGGASMSVQRNVLKKNPRVIIATPGRLMDHLEKKTVDLSRVEVFVLDEADRMLDMGFIPDIKKIMKSIPDQRQTMLFSATMPKEIEAIAEKLMRAPTRIEIDRSGATPAEVSHEMFIINKQDKSRLLALQLKQCSGPVLVFTKTKWMAKKLTAKVNNMGFATAQIHSNRSQEQRRSALEGFRRGRYQILIATDIAARGIDVSGIELVVNYDMPANSEDYVHRIGRTGRAGKTGHAVS
ncbi:MAG: DEAD/DEAH box helicase, partial [candidate division Zixibacteria bacterium]|nr:DEAD/DEAH box helicase [candidate division Zixibacteria bacterium]